MRRQRITIDRSFISARFNSMSVIDVAKELGISIPRFCYHELLSVAGNCRMCMVEVDVMEKPAVACSTEVRPGMAIYTTGAFVKKARTNVLEGILLNHPLDCPICDQAGECDLQEQTRYHGATNSRYFQPKRTAEDKPCNPIVKTVMTRCITCTRCVRFATEVAGEDYFGTVNRGRSTEIGTFNTEALFNSSLSGNVVDLCPVGALNSAVHSGRGRPWELHKLPSIDITDGLGLQVYVELKENMVYRVLPKNTKLAKGNLITDCARFSYQGLSHNRLRTAIINSNAFNQLQDIEGLVVYVDGKVSLEVLQQLVNARKSASFAIRFLSTEHLTETNYFSMQFLSLKAVLRSVTGQINLLGTNLKHEAPVLAAHVKAAVDLHGIALNDTESITLEPTMARGKVVSPLYLIGEAIFNRIDNAQALFSNLLVSTFQAVAATIFLTPNHSILGLFNIKPVARVINKHIALLINPEDNVMSRQFLAGNNLLGVLFATNYSALCDKVAAVIPLKSGHEERSSFVNLEYRVQATNPAINASNKATSLAVGTIIKPLRVLKDLQMFLGDIRWSGRVVFNGCFGVSEVSKLALKHTVTNGFIKGVESKNSSVLVKCHSQLNHQFNYSSIRAFSLLNQVQTGKIINSGTANSTLTGAIVRGFCTAIRPHDKFYFASKTTGVDSVNLMPDLTFTGTQRVMFTHVVVSLEFNHEDFNGHDKTTLTKASEQYDRVKKLYDEAFLSSDGTIRTKLMHAIEKVNSDGRNLLRRKRRFPILVPVRVPGTFLVQNSKPYYTINTLQASTAKQCGYSASEVRFLEHQVNALHRHYDGLLRRHAQELVTELARSAHDVIAFHPARLHLSIHGFVVRPPVQYRRSGLALVLKRAGHHNIV